MKAFVLHSGGIDSSTCLAQALQDLHALDPMGNVKEAVVGISVYYGQRHRKEIDHAKMVCGYHGVKHHTIRAPEQPESMLTDPSRAVPNVSYAELPKGVSPTYVPFRNGQLLSQVTAVLVAQLKEGEDGLIYFGAHAEDAQNWAYPDCTPEFIGAMANAIFIGTYQQVRLVTPLEWLYKADIIRLGTHLGVPWELTWSCYKGDALHCGTCPTCRARQDGFAKAIITDPTKYESFT